MADHEPTTRILPTREPRPLIVPYVLTPGELAGLLRIRKHPGDVTLDHERTGLINAQR
jgi:hypothetical protein